MDVVGDGTGKEDGGGGVSKALADEGSVTDGGNVMMGSIEVTGGDTPRPVLLGRKLRSYMWAGVIGSGEDSADAVGGGSGEDNTGADEERRRFAGAGLGLGDVLSSDADSISSSCVSCCSSTGGDIRASSRIGSFG